jgi:signal transduction histidine kinase
LKNGRLARLRSRPRPLSDALWTLGVCAAVTTAIEIGLILAEPGPYRWLPALFPVVGLVYAVVGLAAWARRSSSRLGLLLVIGGGLWMLGGVINISAPTTEAVGQICETLILGLIVQLLLAFPSGRLHGRAEIAVVLAGYFVCLAMQAPLYLFAPEGPLSIADRPDLVEAGINWQRIVGAVVVLATSALLVQRMRRADPGQRRVLVPLAVYGIIALVYAPLNSWLWKPGSVEELQVGILLELGLLALVPVVFVAAASRGGFDRTSDIGELGVWLGAEELERPELGEALAAALGDPSAELLFRVPGESGLVDSRGMPSMTSTSAQGRGVVEVELGGRAVGAILYDASLADRPEEVREAGRVIALALDRERLTVELRASRARIAAAADKERRRIARDLHDGLQSRLVFLAVQAATDSDRAALVAGIQAATDELRELVDGVMPAQLTERGLGAAVEDLGDRLPITIELQVEGLEARLRPEVEIAAYFVVSEAVVNAVKHAGPSAHLRVGLRCRGGELLLEVTDDGGGGARPGGGIRGMADRVEALGGELTVETSAEDGTRVRATIPCG